MKIALSLSLITIIIIISYYITDIQHDEEYDNPFSRAAQKGIDCLSYIQEKDSDKLFESLKANPEISREDINEFLSQLESVAWPIKRTFDGSRVDPEKSKGTILTLPKDSNFESAAVELPLTSNGRKGFIRFYFASSKKSVFKGIEIFFETKVE